MLTTSRGAGVGKPFMVGEVGHGRGWPEGDPSSALSSQAAVRLPPLVERGDGCGPLCSFSCSCVGSVAQARSPPMSRSGL